MLTPIPFWNASEGQKRNHLPAKSEVLDMIQARSQSGVLYRVKTLGGDFRDLDAAWFEPPNGEVRGASPLAGEASSAEGATSTVVLEAGRPRREAKLGGSRLRCSCWPMLERTYLCQSRFVPKTDGP